MAEDAKSLWDTYYVLTQEMQKFLDREDVDAFLDIAEQRNVIFDRMQASITPEDKETKAYKEFLAKLQPVAKDVMARAKSWLARSKQRNVKVRAYTSTPGFQPNGHMVNTKF
ncbi:MAG: flagellar protein FliT [Schwartzia sp.]|nr:flagellar protein FliT [Schwartzia sp. (in: firmicutes)]MBR1759961.1 flagellar protein FliT [Schwartzia sp. (in: firmicutes)]MBR1886310.1 flagellar protein FliT [Schwartzia sp. (in: firmicutes)]